MPIWKDIDGFPFYQVSRCGKVRSLDRVVERNGHRMKLKGKILKPGVGVKGHLYVNLRRDNKAFSTYVHRLVLFAFVGPPPTEKHEVAHNDGDPSNNHVDNLRWATSKENNEDRIRHGTIRSPSGFDHFRAKLTKDDLHFIKAQQGRMPVREIAKKLKVAHSTVLNVIHGRSYRGCI